MVVNYNNIRFSTKRKSTKNKNKKTQFDLAFDLLGKKAMDEIRTQQKLTIDIAKLNTRINKKFFVNDSEIMINKLRLDECNEEDMIYDCELYKLPSTTAEKVAMLRYFQMFKNKLDYYPNAFSSSVWKQKPLYSQLFTNIKECRIISVKSE